MAYWGEAMTYNHPLWRQQDREHANTVLAKLTDPAPTPREQGYLDALRILYGEGDKVSRDFAYSEAMRQTLPGVPRGLGGQELLRPVHPGHDAGGARLQRLYAGCRGRRRSLCDQPPASGRRPLPDPLLRRSSACTSRIACRPGLRRDRPGRVPRPAHDLAHLCGSRSVGRFGRFEYPVVRSLQGTSRAQGARSGRSQLPRVPLAAVLVSTTRPMGQGPGDAEADARIRPGEWFDAGSGILRLHARQLARGDRRYWHPTVARCREHRPSLRPPQIFLPPGIGP